MSIQNHLSIAFFSLMLCIGATSAPTTQPVLPAHRDFRPGKDFALFFAVSDYKHWDDLQNPIKDAEAIAADLEKYYGFNKANIEIVRNPTYDAVIETLNRYTTDLIYPGDAQLFIFFTGHGMLNSVNEGFFVPQDGRVTDPSQQSYLLHARIANLVNNIPCKHILLGIDACFSGSFMRSIRPKGKPGVRPNVTEATIKAAFIEDMLQYKSRLVITSGGEVPTNDNSQFARQILAALRSRGGESGIVDFYGLVSYLQSARPQPRFGEFGDSDPGAQFLLVYAGPPPQTDTDEADWQKALSSGNYRQYIKDHPTGLHLDAALDNMAGPATRTDNMVLITAGSFQMGSEDGDDDEKPVHKVSVSDFYLSKYEVTVAEFRAFIEDSGYKTDAEKEGTSRAYVDSKWQDVADRNWRHDPEGNAAADKQPVINVSWNDATAYCQWLSQKNGVSYRLPTEAEWEYAAGNGARHTKYSWGNSEPSGRKGGSLADETGASHFNWTKSATRIFMGYDDGFASTAPVGAFDSNDFGLFDMTGNVSEWCSDWYDTYPSSSQANPIGPASGSIRVLRGGSWYDYPQHCRVAVRYYYAPGNRSLYVGFRLARTK